VARVTGLSVPSVPSGWYFAGPASVLKPGTVSEAVAGRSPVAVFRTERAALYAIDGHCGHLGARLALGDVCGERLRCRLHHRSYDGNGRCNGGALDVVSYPVVEAFSAVLVHSEPGSPAPSPALDGDFVFRTGRTVRLRCSWAAALANGFDVEHLRIVHRRELLVEPAYGRHGEDGFRLRYRSRPTGGLPADALLRRLAPEGVDVTITCRGGTVAVVESAAGRRRAALALFLRPVGDDAVEIVPVVGVPRSRVGAGDGVRTALARWLYTSFLARDVAVLEGMRFRPRPVLPDDACLAAFLDFASSLPSAGELHE
jgi:nitrite reductase/ring-hydroxylating ferredoxin subunit